MADHITHRRIVYRLLPGSPARARKLAACAGTCRCAWNAMLELKYQADAWQRFFRGQGGRPRFKRRGNDSVTIPDNVRIRNGKLWFPKIGWLALRRHGGNPWPDGKPLRVVVKRDCGKWYACVCYAVAAVGVAMNAGQVASSDGAIHHKPATRRLEARRKRYARKMARQVRLSRRREKTRKRRARTTRRIAMIRRDWQHKTSRTMADAAHTVVVEDLKTATMTASAKGMLGAPGKNVRAKAGLNRVILDTGWTDLRQMLDDKAARLIAVNPAHTSQTCAACGTVDAASRPSQAVFKCVACGHADHADLNAARNIRRRGMAHLHEDGVHGNGALPPGTPTIREMERRLAA